MFGEMCRVKLAHCPQLILQNGKTVIGFILDFTVAITFKRFPRGGGRGEAFNNSWH